MHAATNLVAHLRPCRVDVAFEDKIYTLPALDAVAWIGLIEEGDSYEIFPTLAGQEAIEHVEDALWEGRVTREQVADVGLEAIGAAADRPWWVATNVIVSAREAWSVVHVNSASGLSLAGWLDEVWSKIMAHIDPKKRAAWETQITKPPAGVESTIEDFDDEEKAFLAAMNAVMK